MLRHDPWTRLERVTHDLAKLMPYVGALAVGAAAWALLSGAATWAQEVIQ